MTENNSLTLSFAKAIAPALAELEGTTTERMTVSLDGYTPEPGSRLDESLTWPSELNLDAKGACEALYTDGQRTLYSSLPECLEAHELEDEHLVDWLSDNGQEEAAQRVAVLTDPDMEQVGTDDERFPKCDGSVLLVEDSGAMAEIYWSERRGVWVVVDDSGYASMTERLVVVEGIVDDDPDAYNFVDRYRGPGDIVATDFDEDLAFYLLADGEDYDESQGCGFVVWDSKEV